jgi:hypothetical protein
VQNVSFQIVDILRDNWFPIINEIEKHGYKVEHDPPEAKTMVFLSGLYSNPFYANGRKILLVYKKEWGILWDDFYKPVLEEYYDKIILIGEISVGKLLKEVGGDCDTSKSRSKD